MNYVITRYNLVRDCDCEYSIRSTYFSRNLALITLGLAFLPAIYIHAIMLPKKGINGWTGEPKEKYYELRGFAEF